MNIEYFNKTVALLNGCGDLDYRKRGVLSEAFSLLNTLIPIAKESYRVVNEEEIKDLYYTAECKVCDWFGPSNLLLGGGPIADTGDFNDPICPVCSFTDIEEKDQHKDKP